jgi:hypothetical protein
MSGNSRRAKAARKRASSFGNPEVQVALQVAKINPPAAGKRSDSSYDSGSECNPVAGDHSATRSSVKRVRTKPSRYSPLAFQATSYAGGAAQNSSSSSSSSSSSVTSVGAGAGVGVGADVALDDLEDPEGASAATLLALAEESRKRCELLWGIKDFHDFNSKAVELRELGVITSLLARCKHFMHKSRSQNSADRYIIDGLEHPMVS